MAPEPATTAGGFLLVPAILTPIAGMILSFALGGRWAGRIALAMSPVWLAIALAIAALVWRSGAPLVYVVGAVAPPLGIALEADGISAAMLVVTALILPAACLFADADFAGPGQGESRGSLVFWIMLEAIGAALSLLFLGRDLFNLYVGVELLTFAAAPLVCVKGSPETLAAALRYLLFALAGSAFYLLGVALLYGTYGTLDIALLAERVRSVPSVWLAAALMTTGMMAKTALFPLHLWLPPAHANAPPAASAVLSGLVVKGLFFVVVRLSFDMLPGLPVGAPSAFAALLGSAAILFGSVLALRQERLKLLVAYSSEGGAGRRAARIAERDEHSALRPGGGRGGRGRARPGAQPFRAAGHAAGSGMDDARQSRSGAQSQQSAQAQVDAAEAQLKTAGDLVSFTVLEADAPGLVTAVGPRAGAVVQAGQMIATLARKDGRDAVFDVPAQTLRQAPADGVVAVRLANDPNVTAQGRVREVSPQADPVTRLFEVRVGLTNPPPAMLLGATVTGEMRVESDRALDIPATALTRFNGQPGVWLVDPKTMVVSPRNVEVARFDPATVAISGGLSAGEVVVTAGVQALSEWALNRRSIAIYLMLIAVGAGVLSSLRLGRAEDPSFVIKMMVVHAVWPGATAEERVKQVTERLERTLQETPELDHLRSLTRAGENAVVDASSSRFRPIMLTAVSTVLGLIPIRADRLLGADGFRHHGRPPGRNPADADLPADALRDLVRRTGEAA